jgi:hypothetical protein
MTQAELNGYHRTKFIEDILTEVNSSHKVRFLAIKNHHNLVEVKKIHEGEWEFSVGDKRFFSHRMSTLVEFLENIWDSCEIVPLYGEANIQTIHPEANADAELSTEMVWPNCHINPLEKEEPNG